MFKVILKKVFKKIIKNDVGIPSRLFIINAVFQRVFRLDSDCRFQKNYTSRVLCGSKLAIEDDCPVVKKSLAASGGCYIQACEGIKIGKGTIWSFNVSLVSQGHDMDDFSCIPPTEPINIGRHCWIGANTSILPGVELGNKTIVGANSVVTKSFPEGQVVIGGVPARIIRRLA